MTTLNFAPLLTSVQNIIIKDDTRTKKLQAVCVLLEAKVPHYDWVGFYWVAPNQERELVLGEYIGEPTEHTHIAFGQGICGQAAETEHTFIIQDVTQETNYLSCSLTVKSEIVIPIFKDEQVIGELDIDSHQISPFTLDDRAFLEKVTQSIATLF